jgi:HSP20 family protein
MTTCAPEITTRYVIPRVNIVEETDSVIIEAELPGVSKESVTLEVKEGELVLVGKREQRASNGHYVLRERAAAHYRRAFALSNALDTNKVDASMKDGVLTITLPKTDRVKPRKININ